MGGRGGPGGGDIFIFATITHCCFGDRDVHAMGEHEFE